MINKIHPLHLDDLKNPEQMASYIKTNDYQALIMRTPSLTFDGLKYFSHSFTFIDDSIYTYNHKKQIFEVLTGETGDFIVYWRKNMSTHQRIVDNYSIQIDKLEDDLYERKLNRLFMDIWVDLKRDLAKVQRTLKRQMTGVQNFCKELPPFVSDHHHEFMDILSDAKSLLANLEGLIARLEVIHHFSTTLRSERLNRNIYFLTIISAIFLPMNLIVGYFGINTPGLLWLEHPQGSLQVFSLLIAVISICLLAVPTLKLVDKILLRKLLRKRDLYQVLYDKIEDLFKL